ncbi:hypothetical protein RhiirA5_369531 [Rhizophagus irregularis]|uniref:Crinkler family protein n=1 Tax=Rhizophagus irregularis TaxID=588596 RepID=A0A2N0QCM8_9GLOM|nr:hypothetical protein RhiirA5_369531 [Rhizophagus irregularis]
MDMSFNLHVLKSDSCDLLTVDIYKKKDEDEDIYVELDNKKYYLNSLKVKHLRDYVCRINGVERIENENISTEDDITQKLSGEEMKIRTLFKTHFKDELSKLERDKDYELVSSIITIIPDGTSGCGKTRTCYELLCENWGLILSHQNKGTEMYSYDDDIFRVLMLKLIACPPSSVTALIIEIYMEFDKETFIIILDEIQVLETVDKGKFRSRTNEQEERSLLSPLVQAMREPASSVSDNRYFIPCGTGLGILSLEDVLN